MLRRLQKAAVVMGVAALLFVASVRPDAVSADPSLILHWTFDDGTATDSSGNSNDGTVNGAVLLTPGHVGPGALTFDGTNDYVDAGNLDLAGSNASFAAWVNPTNLANCGSWDCRIVSKASGVSTQDHYFMISTINSGGPKLRFRLKANGSTATLIAGSGNLSNGQWHHVAATYDGVNMRIYLDGVEVGSRAKTGTIDANPGLPLWVGANPLVASARPWDGDIDDVRLYSRTLSPTEIQALATGVVNDPPVAVDDPGYSVDEDNPLSVAAPGVLGNDTDTEGDPLSAQLVSTTPNGTLTLNPDGSFDYTPDLNFNGPDSFVYRAVDATGSSNNATATITVNAINDPPVANPQAVNAEEGVPLAITLTGTDVDGDTLTFALGTGPTNGGLIGTPPNVIYTSNTPYTGPDSFTFTVDDGSGPSPEATVDITVSQPSADLLFHWTFDDGTASDSSGNSNDGTVNGAVLLAPGHIGPGALTFDGTGDHVSAGNLDVPGSSASFAAWVNPTDLANCGSWDCRIVSKASGVSTQDHYFMISTINSGGPKLRFRLKAGGSTATLIAGSGNLSNGQWHHIAATYDGVNMRIYLDGVEVGSRAKTGTIDANPGLPLWVGANPLVASARPWDGAIDDVRLYTRTLSLSEIQVLAAGIVNNPPFANDDLYTVDEDDVLSVPADGVLANDTDAEGDPLTAQLISNASNGTVSLSGDGSFTYTPDTNYNGPDSFTYRASDATGTSNTATVNITVSPINDPPVANPQAVIAEEGTPLDITLTGTDVDGDTLTFVIATGPANGGLLGTPPNVTYTSNTPYIGPDLFTFTVNDGTVTSLAATVDITVIAPNVPPTAVDDIYSTPEDTQLVVIAPGVLANDNDPESAAMTAELVTTTTNGNLTLNPDGSFTYTPNPDFHGSDSFVYRANDGIETSSDATVNLTINPVNDPPLAGDDQYNMTPDTTLIVDALSGVLADDTDTEGDSLTASLVTDVSSGVLALSSDGSFTYTPTIGFSGIDSFTYKANDGSLDSNIATVTITVSSTNTAPTIVTGQIEFGRQVIASDVNQTHFVVAADYNGDGEIDLVATDFVDDTVFWYENDGTGGFITHVVDSALDGAYPAHTDDLDQDGDVDILASGYIADTHAWYENDGLGNFTRHNIDTTANGAHSLMTIDVDGDGDIDVVTSEQDGDSISWYENDGAENFTLHTIDSAANGAKRAEGIDVDGDGDIDVVAAITFDNAVTWYENNGSESFTKHVISTNVIGAYFVSPADVDGDGDVDIFSAGRWDDTISWFENDGSENFTEHIMDSSADGARTVIATDINGDGNIDALTAAVNSDAVSWYENDGAENFTRHDVDLSANGAYGIFPIDMDRDGDVDVLSASRDSFVVALHTQFKAHSVFVLEGGSTTIETADLQTTDADDSPAGLTYTLTTTPAQGDIALSGTPLGLGGTFTQADVDASLVTYEHAGLASDPDSFEFTVEDGGENDVEPATGTFDLIPTPDGGPPSVDAGLILHWTFDDGTATDSTANGNDGTVNGPVLFTPGQVGAGALSFDGANDYVDAGNMDFSGTAVSFAAWFNADNLANCNSFDCRIVSKASGVSTQDHYFMVSTINSGGTKLRFRLKAGGTTTTLIGGSGIVSNGQWHHIAATYGGSEMRLYLDGVLVGSIAKNGVIDVNAGLPLWVGGNPPGPTVRPWDGLVDDVRLYDRALTLQDVQTLAGLTP